MAKKIALEPAYLLHARPYRNTSLLADFFTLRHGRVNGVVRGARGSKSKLQGTLQYFLPLEMGWIETGDLVTIYQIESARTSEMLSGEAILYGFYINELLVRLLRVREAHTDLYTAYEIILTDLINRPISEIQLRLFEKRLLHALGYGLQLTHEYDTGEAVEKNQWYDFFPDRGAQRIAKDLKSSNSTFSGASLLALEKEDLSDETILHDAKRLMRQALTRLLGNKPIKSRELFIL